ncbi:MAG: TIGR03862 family flavoprotein [Boseongicola sp.]|nr:TIGR03862 family flavoprotein [Boseongicola sp.]
MPTGFETVEALVVGAGPAGLAAAEVLSAGGRSVVIVDAMPSVGRKFLMAGKSGLNLTKDEDDLAFRERFGDGSEAFRESVEAFGPKAVQDWARGLGEEVFTGTTGRVFPRAMKASPLLRRWMGRLGEQGVEVRTRWRWTGWDGAGFMFSTPDGAVRVAADVVVTALGGGSWARLGSDGEWAEAFVRDGIDCRGFEPSNAGLRVNWTNHMTVFLGMPVKGTALCAGDVVTRGEWVISERGIEGGGVYELTRAVREGASLTMDLVPEWSVEDVKRKLTKPRGKMSTSNYLRKAVSLSGVQRALLMEWARPLPEGVELAALVKSVPVPVSGLFPLDEAISTAGGVAWDALDGFMLRARPGVFVAGEMLDWDAPTGGYLITGCLATGRAAAVQALAYQSA